MSVELAQTASNGTHDFSESAYRHQSSCVGCNSYVAEKDLVECHDENGVKDLSCPNCFVPHYLVNHN